MNKTTKELAVKPTEESLALLKEQFPVDQGFTRALLPRLGMFSQDQMEGKGKDKKVVSVAGTFYIEKQTNEEDENGKKIWSKEEIGTEIDGIIIYQRKQLSYYDEKNKIYTSSPIYDDNDEVIPLFCNKQEVCRGTSDELKKRPEFQKTEDGKTKSKLQDNVILYVIYKGDVYQMNLHGTSMWAFKTYSRKYLCPAIETHFCSEAKENGQIAWNQMTFTKLRELSQEEVDNVLEKQSEIRNAILAEKSYFAQINDALDKF